MECTQNTKHQSYSVCSRTLLPAWEAITWKFGSKWRVNVSASPVKNTLRQIYALHMVANIVSVAIASHFVMRKVRSAVLSAFKDYSGVHCSTIHIKCIKHMSVIPFCFHFTASANALHTEPISNICVPENSRITYEVFGWFMESSILKRKNWPIVAREQWRWERQLSPIGSRTRKEAIGDRVLYMLECAKDRVNNILDLQISAWSAYEHNHELHK